MRTVIKRTTALAVGAGLLVLGLLAGALGVALSPWAADRRSVAAVSEIPPPVEATMTPAPAPSPTGPVLESAPPTASVPVSERTAVRSSVVDENGCDPATTNCD